MKGNAGDLGGIGTDGNNGLKGATGFGFPGRPGTPGRDGQFGFQGNIIHPLQQTYDTTFNSNRYVGVGGDLTSALAQRKTKKP